MHHLWAQGDYEISTDPARIDAVMVYEFLTNSYWARGISLATVRLSIENSIAFGVYHGRQLVGFARIISDLATFAYLGDVFNSALSPRARTFPVAHGVHRKPPGPAGTPALDARNPGRSRTLRKVWFRASEKSRLMDGNSSSGCLRKNQQGSHS